MRIKDTAALAKKFVTRAQAAAGEYKAGVEATGQDWQTNTAASSENYATGVQQAIADNRFRKGVESAGSAKFVRNASTLGASRFGPGIANAESEWAKGVQPSLDALKSMQLPPRRPKGDPGNQLRAAAVAERLRAVKLGR
jgi:hypothetical protein